MAEQWRAVARVGQLRPGDVIAVEVEGQEIALGRDGDRYFAVQRRCAHLRGDLADGIIARGHLVCPQHGWRFSTATGCHDEASAYCLVRYAVRVAAGQIEVDPVPLPGPEPGPEPRPEQGSEPSE
jgi:nitrite reductase/ring-hydroxylating ferredoxin subunit